MDIYLPYKDFFISALVLDPRRLNTQRSSCLSLLKKLRNPNMVLSNNSIFLMWSGYEEALKLHFNILNFVWILRGYKNNMEFLSCDYDHVIFPPWLGDQKFHDHYQDLLIEKDYQRYNKIFKNINH